MSLDLVGESDNPPLQVFSAQWLIHGNYADARTRRVTPAQIWEDEQLVDIHCIDAMVTGNLNEPFFTWKWIGIVQSSSIQTKKFMEGDSIWKFRPITRSFREASRWLHLKPFVAGITEEDISQENKQYFREYLHMERFGSAEWDPEFTEFSNEGADDETWAAWQVRHMPRPTMVANALQPEADIDLTAASARRNLTAAFENEN